MNGQRYRTGDTIRILSELQFDSSGNPDTGLSDVLLLIQRESDGQFYDFDDDTFKAGSHTDIDQVMSETDATNAPGIYEFDWNTADITNAVADDRYLVIVSSATAANLPSHATILLGDYVDPVYQAKVVLIDDNDAPVADRYVVEWFRDTEPVTSGITLPTIQVVKSSDGMDLVASVAMTEFGTHHFMHDETSNRVVDGESYSANVTMTHDGAVRTFRQPLGRDSEA